MVSLCARPLSALCVPSMQQVLHMLRATAVNDEPTPEEEEETDPFLEDIKAWITQHLEEEDD
jgi:hypothetical protein